MKTIAQKVVNLRKQLVSFLCKTSIRVDFASCWDRSEEEEELREWAQADEYEAGSLRDTLTSERQWTNACKHDMPYHSADDDQKSSS